MCMIFYFLTFTTLSTSYRINNQHGTVHIGRIWFTYIFSTIRQKKLEKHVLQYSGVSHFYDYNRDGMMRNVSLVSFGAEDEAVVATAASFRALLNLSNNSSCSFRPCSSNASDPVKL